MILPDPVSLLLQLLGVLFDPLDGDDVGLHIGRHPDQPGEHKRDVQGVGDDETDLEMRQRYLHATDQPRLDVDYLAGIDGLRLHDGEEGSREGDQVPQGVQSDLNPPVGHEGGVVAALVGVHKALGMEDEV